MNHRFRLAIFPLLVLLAACQADTPAPAGSQMKHAGLTHIDNLRQWAEKACRDNRVLTVLIAREDCPWCDKLKQQVLLPDLKNGLFADQWLLGELRIDEGESVRDFSGRLVPAATLARAWGAELTPTVLFLNRRGEEIAPRIVGLKLVEFYDDYLQKSLRQGLENPERCT